MSAHKTPVRRTSLTCAAIVLACLFIVGAIWAMTYERIAFEHADDIAEEYKENANLALALEEHTIRTLQAIDQTFGFLAHEYLDDGSPIDFARLIRNERLDISTLNFLGLVDAKGRLFAGSGGDFRPIDVSDRDYFRHHRANPGTSLRLGHPIVGRIAGKPGIQVSRRMSHADGSFAGVVVAGVRPESFESFYRNLDVGDDGVVQLVGLDGIALARRTAGAFGSGQDMRGSTLVEMAQTRDAGGFLSHGRLEGVQRFQSFRVLRDLGVVVAVGSSEREVLAESRARARMYVAGSGGATLFILIFGAALILSLRRQKRSMASMQAAEALYRVTFEQAAVGISHHSLDGRFLRANRLYCEMVGYSEDELRQKRFADLLQPEDRPNEADWQRVLAAGNLVVENRHVRKDGAMIWVSVAVALVRNEGGSPDYLVAMARDVTPRKQAEQALLRAEVRYRAAFEEAGVGIAHTSLDGRLLRANRKLCSMLGYTQAELCTRRVTDVTHPDDLETSRYQMRALALNGQSSGEFEKRYLRKDGSAMWAQVTAALVRDAAGAPEYFVTMIQDISTRREAEERNRATFEQTAVGIAHATLEGRFIKVNRKLCDLLGYEEPDLLQRSFQDVTFPEDRRLSVEQVQRLVEDEARSFAPEYEKRYVRKDGTPVWVSILVSLVRNAQGRPDYFIAMVQDVSARKEAQAKLEYSAHHDPLTGLPNRALLVDRLTQALNQARRRDWKVAVLTVNLDRFKAVNHALGHDSGDRLLREAASRLLASVRGGDTVAHMNGDEFVVVASEIGTAEGAGRVAHKIIDAMSAPFRLDGHEVFVTASVGIAVHPGDGADGETLLRNSAAAMQRAKQLGRNTCQFYAAPMNARATEALLLEADLRYALRRNEFVLHFQPRASITDGRVSAFEALLRWQRPGERLVPPAEFIPVLEASGLIVAAGEWVIRAACAQVSAWQRAGFGAVPIAVNVSAQQFLMGDLYSVIDAALREHGVDASLLEIEITESDAMRDPERAVEVLRRIRERGVRVAIDDFGTGYSSLSYLKRFPIDFLKLDRSFVTGLPLDADDVSIARAVIGMAHSLGLRVIAEGVENEAQRGFLARNACDEMQGYLFSRPVPAADCLRFLGHAVEEATA